MAKAKAKAKAAPAAQSRDEVVQLIGRMGDLSRQMAREEADYGDKAARLKTAYEARVEPLSAEFEAAQAKVQGWCEANRAAITREGKVKFAKFTTGEVKWRARPASVKIRGMDAVITLLKAPELRHFLREKFEVNRDALLADPDAANAIPGVSVSSEGEDFVVEPHNPELVGAAA